ncbi:hypothetical protein IFM46972_11128 [Aspergillus udagawae]|uniref:Uncharacterized protein n=1 Tax=Aspergillus udagawae TaxID=91492 RepID=A0A8H3XR28_9EURO|nr:hypothetical protein IFM46972_11128 [Aspergillus udagawae]
MVIECVQYSTYNGDGILKPDGHCDPSGMFPGSLSFFPDVGLFYLFQFLEDLEAHQASTNLIVIPELPALQKLTISYEDSHRDFGCVEVDLSTLPWLSTFGLENMYSQSLLISGEALALRRVTISWSDFDLLDLQKLGQNIEEIEAMQNQPPEAPEPGIAAFGRLFPPSVNKRAAVFGRSPD